MPTPRLPDAVFYLLNALGTTLLCLVTWRRKTPAVRLWPIFGIWCLIVMILHMGCACGGRTEPLQTLIVPKVLGLNTNTNQLAAPVGSCSVASDVVLDVQGEARTRPGLETVANADTNDTVNNSGHFYGGDLVVQSGSAHLSHVASNGTTTQYSGSYTPPSGTRTQFAEANGNLYFTTNAGVYKLDSTTGASYAATTTGAVLAGGPVPLHQTLSQTATAGFMAANSQVGYRHVWYVRDANSTVIVGPVSQRDTITGFANPKTTTAAGLTRVATTVTVTFAAAHGYVTNDVVWLDSTDSAFPSGSKVVTGTGGGGTTFTYTESGTASTSTVAQSFYYASRNVSVTIRLPSAVQANGKFFCQVYRTTDSASAGTDPGDEEYLAFEYAPTNVDVTAKYFTFTDSVQDALLGAPLYTNATEEGSLASNDPPPLANTLAAFDGSMVFGSITPSGSKLLTLLAVPSAAEFAILPNTYTSGSGNIFVSGASTENVAAHQFKLYTSGTAAENIAHTTQSIVRVINEDSANTLGMRAVYLGTETAPGSFLLRPASPLLTWYVYAVDTPLALSPRLQTLFSVTAGLTSRAANVVTVTLGSAHDFVVGQQIRLYSEDGVLDSNFSTGLKTVASTPSSTTFTYNEAGANATLSVSTTYDVIGFGATATVVASGSNVAVPGETVIVSSWLKNGLAESKIGQFEAVPLTNYELVGTATSEILRLMPLRTSLFVFKQAPDGLWRAGHTASGLTIEPFDPTVVLVGRDAVVQFNNALWALTTTGIVRITESGVQRMDDPIHDLIATALLLPANIDAVKTNAFAVGHETNREFILWAHPSSFSTTPRSGNVAYVFNAASGAWTTWTGKADASFALMNESTNKLWLFGAGATREGDFATERRTGTVADYQDADGSAITPVVTFTPFTMGDISQQKQFSKVAFMFDDARMNNATASFSTDLVTSTSTVALSDNLSTSGTTGAVVTYVPTEAQLGSRLTVSFTGSTTAQQKLSLAGLRVTFQPISDAPNR